MAHPRTETVAVIGSRIHAAVCPQANACRDVGLLPVHPMFPKQDNLPWCGCDRHSHDRFPSALMDQDALLDIIWVISQLSKYVRRFPQVKARGDVGIMDRTACQQLQRFREAVDRGARTEN